MTHDGSVTRRNRYHLRPTVTAAIVAGVAAAAGWLVWSSAGASPGERLAKARSLRAAGDLASAEEAAAAAWKADPSLGEAALVAAECAASQNEFRRAVEYAGRVAAGSPRVRYRAAMLAARLNYERLHCLSDAEHAYRAAIEIEPDDAAANTGLANLLALCGRKSEAVPNILRVVRRDRPTDLLMLFARESGSVDDLELLASAREAAPDDPNPLLGLAWRAASAERNEEAIDLIREALRLQPDLAAGHVALGRRLLAAGRFDELDRWAVEVPRPAESFAEVWLVRGRLAERAGDKRAAIRCYWEAVRRAAESKAPSLRLASLLADLGDAKAAARFGDHLRRLQDLEQAQDRVLFSDSRPSLDSMLELTERYEAAGRLWEAYGWCLIALQVDPARQDFRERLAALRPRVAALHLRLTADSVNPASAVDLSTYPLPRPATSGVVSREIVTAPRTSPLFRDDATAAGIAFRYFNGTSGEPSRRMFEFTGGGIAAIDFDLDAGPDLFFAQGCPWPPGALSDGYADRLFRNQGGTRFDDASAAAGVVEADFGQGVSVGDFDADGFPDLYVAAIGRNRLWRNNGDGTFADATEAASLDGNEWTASCVLVDIDADGLPDLYDVNYVTGTDVFERVCSHPDGSPAMCMPYDFEGQHDRLWLNAGDGRFLDATADVLPAEQGGKGLGALAWDPFGTGRLSLLVANDTTPNFLLAAERPAERRTRLRDRGIEAGIAFNGDGKATGSMGIALGDADADGRQDLLITNFLAESNTFFHSASDGLFEDRARETGIRAASLDSLGFGTQFFDADLDGRLELFVANGHIDDLRGQGKPYKMRPQLFHRTGGRFEEVLPPGLGPYFEGHWLGRAAIRLDWNGDGREDLAVGHLDADAALLTNTTRDRGRYLSLRLIGVRSNRDAIGTEVRARIGDRTIVRQLAAGDGYMASNERRLTFGTGTAERIDELTVRWPAGTAQRFENVPVSQRVWLREGGRLLTER